MGLEEGLEGGLEGGRKAKPRSGGSNLNATSNSFKRNQLNATQPECSFIPLTGTAVDPERRTWPLGECLPSFDCENMRFHAIAVPIGPRASAEQ